MYDCTLYEARQRMGAAIARSAPVEADLVIGVPDSGTPAAVGYAQASGIPFGEGLAKNRYVGPHLHLAEPDASASRASGSSSTRCARARRASGIVVVDDSIVRGNTTKKLVALLREAGAAEVHMRITSPPVKWPCFYGIDTDTQEQLIASQQVGRGDPRRTSAPTRSRTCRSRTWSPPPARPPTAYCLACFNGDYPIEIPESVRRGKMALEGTV